MVEHVRVKTRMISREIWREDGSDANHKCKKDELIRYGLLLKTTSMPSVNNFVRKDLSSRKKMMMQDSWVCN